MKILISSTYSHPNVGGYKTATYLIAEHLAKNNFRVKIITYIPDSNSNTYPFEVIHNPSFRQFLSALGWYEVYFQFSASLKDIWQLIFAPRLLLVVHQNWIVNKKNDWKGYLKKLVADFAVNVAVSHAIADKIPTGKGKFVIGNLCQDEPFKNTTDFDKRVKKNIFLGRLVSEKGVDTLLN
jgi:glycogen synthase